MVCGDLYRLYRLGATTITTCNIVTTDTITNILTTFTTVIIITTGTTVTTD